MNSNDIFKLKLETYVLLLLLSIKTFFNLMAK